MQSKLSSRDDDESFILITSKCQVQIQAFPIHNTSLCLILSQYFHKTNNKHRLLSDISGNCVKTCTNNNIFYKKSKWHS